MARSTRKKLVPGSPDLTGFDPDGAVPPGAGLFSMTTAKDESLIHIHPVPFEATASYGRGSARAPRAIRKASHQMDFFDLDTGRPYEKGIYLHPESTWVRRRNTEASRLVDENLRGTHEGPVTQKKKKQIQRVNTIGAELNSRVKDAVQKSLSGGHRVGLLGGDHATIFGSVHAHAKHYKGLGILNFDAHHDLRPAYEGFTWSHASIMHNVLEQIPGIKKLVQVGVRDFSEREYKTCKRSRSKVVCHYDRDIARARFTGTPFDKIARKIVSDLPKNVYVSFDIDGLDPHLCPNTGTPVPGGLSFNEAVHILAEVIRTRRRIVGFDLVEVSPGKDEWDANVGARILYKLIGFLAM